MRLLTAELCVPSVPCVPFVPIVLVSNCSRHSLPSLPVFPYMFLTLPLSSFYILAFSSPFCFLFRLFLVAYELRPCGFENVFACTMNPPSRVFKAFKRSSWSEVGADAVGGVNLIDRRTFYRLNTDGRHDRLWLGQLHARSAHRAHQRSYHASTVSYVHTMDGWMDGWSSSLVILIGRPVAPNPMAYGGVNDGVVYDTSTPTSVISQTTRLLHYA